MLTKKEREELKAISKALPAEISETKETVTVTGADLLRLNPMAIDAKGKPIVRNRKYNVDQFKPVNHYKNILNAYDKGSIAAIDAYCDGVKQRWDEQQKVKEN